ncbi:MAG: hypothetical protein IIB56_19625 [Planctomycetes bacterium]|nr:hypothetical protein [Planctomycetota bacterium]MCH8118566.1 hypothetical protein [Planctomycetota bacterium]
METREKRLKKMLFCSAHNNDVMDSCSFDPFDGVYPERSRTGSGQALLRTGFARMTISEICAIRG